MSNILATIVLFNPNVNQLRNCLASIYSNVEWINFVDNNSNNKDEIKSFVETIPNASVIWNNENQGLSKVFNSQLMQAKQKGFSHLLLLDQDSEPAPNLINELRKHTDKEFICITPLIKHRIKEYQKAMGAVPNGANEIITESINSGSLINLSLLPSNIHFDENLFIDWIDIDFYYQLQKRQLKVLRVNTTHLLVDIGHQKVHHVLKYTWFSSGYSAFRLKKQAQDTVYFKRKNWDHPFLKGHLTFVRWRWLMMLFFEKHKLKKLFALITGTLRGYKLCKKLNLK